MGDKNNKKDNALNVNVSYNNINEQKCYNGEAICGNRLYKSVYANVLVESGKNKRDILTKTYISNNYIPAKPLTLDDLQNYYREHDKSYDDTYNHLITFIKENQDNPEVQQQTISSILDNLYKRYDKSEDTGGAGTTKQVLEKYFNTNTNIKIPGLLCGGIAKAAADILNDCGIPAAVVPEIYNERHAILAYKLNDGEYVFNNYGKNVVIKANNIKDAIAVYAKSEGIIRTPGAKRIVDGKHTYSDYAFKDAAYRGMELSKHSYNKESAFYIEPANTKSGINANITTSNLGNVSADVSANFAKGDKGKNTDVDVSLGFVKKGESTALLNSVSFGSGIEYKIRKTTDKGIKFAGVKGIISVINGKHGGCEYKSSNLNYLSRDNALAEFDDEMQKIDFSKYTKEEQAYLRQSIDEGRKHLSSHLEGEDTRVEQTFDNSTNISNFIKCEYGKIGIFKENGNTSYNYGYKFSGNLLYSKDSKKFGNNSGDYRVIGEGGIGIVNRGKKHTVTGNISAGPFIEYNEPFERSFDLFNAGYKLNANAQIEYRTDKNTVIGAGAGIYDANTCASDNYGINGNIYAGGKYKGITFKANCGVNYESEKIKLSFNEKTEDNITFNALLSGQKGKTTIYSGIQKHVDNLNKTRDYTSAVIGITQTF